MEADGSTRMKADGPTRAEAGGSTPMAFSTENKSCKPAKRQRAGLDLDTYSGDSEIARINDIPFSSNSLLFLASLWTIIFGAGCTIRMCFAIHWNGYVHGLIPLFGLIAISTTVMGYVLSEDNHARIAVLVSIIAWLLSVIVALLLILRTVFVFMKFKKNKIVEGFRSSFFYVILWLFFTDLLSIVTVLIDGLAAYASFRIWRNKGE